MGKGGGKCASRERSGSSVASRTPRLPAKPHHVAPHQSSAKAKDVDRAADTDSATLEPFIPKKMESSQVEEDDDIDTNVMFDQQEIHSHVSDSGRRLLGSPTSAVQSAYNTAMPSPSRSFSSGGGRSPDAFHDAPDELQHFQASPNHPKHIKSGVGVSQQGGVIANASQSSFDSTRPRFQDDDDLFPSKETIIPTSSNNSAVMHLGLRKRATSFHATPSESKNVSSTCNTEAPIVGGGGEETSSPITIISQTSFGLTQPQLGVTPQPQEPSEQATNIEVATPSKQKVDMKEGVRTHESTMPKESGKLSDNWELVPRELGSGSSSPVLVTMSKSSKASEVDPTSQLEAMKTENSKNLKFKGKEIEDDSQQPTNEQEENMKSMASKSFPSEHVVEGLPKEKSDSRQVQNDQPFEEEPDTVRSLGSDQSDDIETHSINGDGGGYVFLGSPQHEESHDIEKLKDDKDFNKGVPIETMFEEQHIPSNKEFQVEDVQPASIEEEEETPIVKEKKSTPIQTLDEQSQHGDLKEPFEIALEHEVEPEEVEPSFKEVSRSLELPISQPIEKAQDDVGVEAPREGQNDFEVREPQIEAPIIEPQVRKSEVQDKEVLILQEQHIPSTEKFEAEDVKPTSIEEEEETPIVKEEKNIPNQTLDELPQHGDVEEPFEIPTEKVEPSFEEVRRSLELPINQHVEQKQHDVGVEAPSEAHDVSVAEQPKIEPPIMEPQVQESEVQGNDATIFEEQQIPFTNELELEDVRPTSIEEQEETPIVKEETKAPIQTLDDLPQDNDVEAPFEVPTKKEVEPKEVEPSFQEVPKSLELPIHHPIEETQGDVGVKALQEGQHVSELEEPQIFHKFEAQDKEAPPLGEPYVPSIEQPQDGNVKPTSIQEEEETPIVKEEMSTPIQTLDELPQNNDGEPPFEVPTKKGGQTQGSGTKF